MSNAKIPKHRLGNPFGGLNSALPPHMIDDSISPSMDGFVLIPEGVEASLGWEKFTTQRLTDGAASPVASTVLKIVEFEKRSGTTYLIGITNKRAYYFNESTDLWIPITPGANASTTVDADSNSGTATLFVASTTGYTIGDTIIINEGGPRQEEAVVNSISAGVSLGLLANLTFTHTAVQADAVRRTYGSAIVDADSASGQTVLNVSHTGQFTVGEEVIIGMGTSREEIRFIQSISAGVSITLTANLGFTHTAVQADKVYRMAGLSFTNTPLEVDCDNDGDVFYFTDGVNTIQQWTATGTPTYTSDLVGLRTGDSVEGIGTLTTSLKAKYIRIFENFIVIGHLTEEGTTLPQKVRWCRRANYTSWVNAADGSGQAGHFSFNGSDFVFKLSRLKRELFIDRETSIEGMSYVGPPDIFAFRRVTTRIGIFSSVALADLGDSHMLLSHENAYVMDGLSSPQIGDDIKKALFDELNPSNRQYVQVLLYEDRSEVWFAIPTENSRVVKKAWVYSLLFRRWVGTRPLSGTAFGDYKVQNSETWDAAVGTWDAQTEIWDSMSSLANAPIHLMGDNLGYIYLLESGLTKDGTPFTRTYYTKLTDCGDSERSKRILEVRIGTRKESTGSLDVYIGTAEAEGDDLTWSASESLSLTGETNGYVYFDQPCKFAQVRIETTASCNIRSVQIGFMWENDIL